MVYCFNDRQGAVHTANIYNYMEYYDVIAKTTQTVIELIVDVIRA